MLNSNSKKLQVFVSSTFKDLQLQRQAAVEAILTAGHIPAGMELFTADDQSQMDIIQDWIDESDVYCLILGGRYGSIGSKSQFSYTQLEYNYAVKTRKPHFSLVIEEKAQRIRAAVDPSLGEVDHPDLLKMFRDSVLSSKMCSIWDSDSDLKYHIVTALQSIARRENLIGWTRPSQANMAVIADEVARLSKENASLREKIGAEGSINGITFSEMKALLDSEGALDSFIESCDYIIGRRRMESKDEKENEKRRLHLASFVKKGLLITSWTSQRGAEYSLSESGNAFLNRLQLENLQSIQDGKYAPDAAATTRTTGDGGKGK